MTKPAVAKLDGEVVRMLIALVVAGQSMAFGLGLNMTPADGWAHWAMHGILLASAVLVAVLLGKPLLENTLESIRDREVSVEMFFLASIVGAFVASLVNTFTGLGYVFYEVVAITLVIYTLGRRLRAHTRARALGALREARDLHAFAEVELWSGGVERRPVAEVRAGDVVRVTPGRPIPVDGQLVEGRAYVDESSLTGEPLPVVRRSGDALRAGTVPVDVAVRVRSTSTEGGRELDRLFRDLEEARLAPSGFQRTADRVTSWFLPLVLLIAAGTFAGWWWLAGWAVALFNAMAVLLVACPCALGMATPVAVWGGLARLAKLGFAARGGDFLDALGRVDRVFFDKTGTLTDSGATVVDFLALDSDPLRRSELRVAVALVERGITHPIALALSSGVDLPTGWELLDRNTLPGAGVCGRVKRPDGTELSLCVGEADATSTTGEGVALLNERLGDATAGKRVWVTIDGAAAGVFLLREHLRPEADGLAAKLADMGVRCEVLTGDPAAPSRFAGMPVRAGLSAAEKRAEVRAAVDAGEVVIVVGDGLNDSSAMAEATASIAIEGGAGLALGTASAVAPGGRLRELPEAVRLGRAVRRGIFTNMVFASCYNFLGMALAAAGLLHPVVAALLMLVSSLIVSVRALRSTKSPEREAVSARPVEATA